MGPQITEGITEGHWLTDPLPWAVNTISLFATPTIAGATVSATIGGVPVLDLSSIEVPQEGSEPTVSILAVTVTAQSGIQTSTFTISITRNAANTNSTITNLVFLGDGIGGFINADGQPIAFNPEVLAHTATAQAGTLTTNVRFNLPGANATATATLSNQSGENQSITLTTNIAGVNGVLNLTTGDNVLTIVVVSEAGTEQAYAVNIVVAGGGGGGGGGFFAWTGIGPAFTNFSTFWPYLFYGLILILVLVVIIVAVVVTKKKKKAAVAAGGGSAYGASTAEVNQCKNKAKDAINSAFAELQAAGAAVAAAEGNPELEAKAMERLNKANEAMTNAENCMSEFLKIQKSSK